MKRYVGGLLMVVLAGACESDETEARPDATVQPDGSMPDGSVPDGSSESDASTTCEVERAALQNFLTAHRACSSDADCTLIGSCSGPSFEAVSTSARDEAQRLADAISCKIFDGPLYEPRCEANTCVSRPSGASCGGRGSLCQSGQALYETNCSDAGSTESACYKKCSGASDGTCPSGFSCQTTQVVSQSGGCAAPKIDAWLCRPAPSCEVALSIDATAGSDPRSYKRYTMFALGDESVSIELWAENLTDAPKTFRYDPRCASHDLTGLGSYDAFGACLAGACPTPIPAREITLQPRERALLGTGMVRTRPSDCNANGLASGSYDVGFTLANVTGAAVCGPDALELKVN